MNCIRLPGPVPSSLGLGCAIDPLPKDSYHPVSKQMNAAGGVGRSQLMDPTPVPQRPQVFPAI